jgi:hypothetical protein
MRPPHHAASFDYFIGAGEQQEWDGDTKRLRRLHLDHELELCRPSKGQIPGVNSAGSIAKQEPRCRSSCED